MSEIKQPNVFKYNSYRQFLKDYVEFKLESTELSYRAFSRRSGINSPNFLQLIIKGSRNLTVSSALKVVKGLNLTGTDKKYFIKLVEFDSAKNTEEKLKVLQVLKNLSISNNSQKILDNSLNSSWLNQIIWELASTKNFQMIPNNIYARLNGLASLGEITESFQFLVDKGYLEKIDSKHQYRQANVSFDSTNDFKNLSLQYTHLKFLKLAEKHFSDPLDHREYQGLTIAVSENKLPFVKNRIREFISQLNEELLNDQDAINVIRIQCQMYKITNNIKVIEK